MSISEQVNDSLIDWNSPPIEQQTTRPLIPLPTFTSPLNDIDVDNPFDALERQINDEVLDLLNVSSLFGSSGNSSTRSLEKDLECEPAAGILIQLDEDSEPPQSSCSSKGARPVPCAESEGQIVPPLEMSTVSSILENSDLREMVVNRISNCINQALNNSVCNVTSRKVTPSSTASRLNEGFISLASSNEQECWRRERSRSVDLSLNGFDVDEDLRSIAMPTWNDEVPSSSDDESNTNRLSRSLPIEGSKSWVKKTSSSRTPKKSKNTDREREPLVTRNPNVKVNREGTVLKSGLKRMADKSKDELKSLMKSDKLQADPGLLCVKKNKVTSTLISKHKQWYAPVASSTPQTHKSSLGKKVLRSNTRGRPSLKQEERNSRAPSPDSTSNVQSVRDVKMTPRFQNRVSKMLVSRKSSLSSKTVSSSLQKPSLKNTIKKENRN